MDDKRNQLDFDIVSATCPWRFDGQNFAKCRPKPSLRNVAMTLNDCKQKNCPIMHFRKYFSRTYM